MFLTALWIALILSFSLKYKIVVQNSFEDGATGGNLEQFKLQGVTGLFTWEIMNLMESK